MTKKLTAEEVEYNVFSGYWNECSIPATYEVEEPEEIMVPMPDGVRLRTICYRPKTGQKRIPLVFMRSPYPVKDRTYRLNAMEFCKRGIAFIFQYSRGRGGSEGVWKPYTMFDRTDGMALIKYIESLDWVGPVGYWGSSYVSMSGWVLMEDLPDCVKTMYLTNYGTERYASCYESGLFKHDLMTGWAKANAGVPIAAGHLESCEYRPQISVDTDLWGVYLDWFRTYLSSDMPDAEFWNVGICDLLRRSPTKTKVPVYHGSSWFDVHFGSAEQTWMKLPGEVKEHSTYRIGCWEHSFYPCMQGHPQENLEINNLDRCIRWFKDILVDGKQPEKGVEIYTIGADSWSKHDQYPIPADDRAMYLSSKKSEPNAGTLSWHADETASEVTYQYDPENYVPSCGGEIMFAAMDQRGSIKQPPCGYRPDVLSFRSDVIDEDITITGAIRGKLMVKSTAEDTAFTIKIMEEFPDGSTYNLRNGIRTLAFRNGMEKRETYTPGTYVELEIPTWSISWKPARGSRIRVDIASSDFPQYALHSNFPGPFAEQAKTQIAEQTLLLGGENSSRIILPIQKV